MSDAGEPQLPITGGCMCGAVRYSIDALPVVQRMCWCRLCQQNAAGGPTVSAIFPTEAISVTGEVRHFEVVADSGNVMRRAFCPQCGTPLFNRGSRRPEMTVVRVGSLDHPEQFPPHTQIWASRRPAWVDDLPNIPMVAGQS